MMFDEVQVEVSMVHIQNMVSFVIVVVKVDLVAEVGNWIVAVEDSQPVQIQQYRIYQNEILNELQSNFTNISRKISKEQ